MPFVRTTRGSRSRFSPAKISATLTRAYHQAFGPDNLHRWRPQIQNHALAVIDALKKELGYEEGTEWPRAKIDKALRMEIMTRASIEVQEAYLEQHPDNRNEKTHQGANPVWSVQRTQDNHRKTLPPNTNPMTGLGETVRRLQKRRVTAERNNEEMRKPALRSDWIEMWHAFSLKAIHALDWSVFLRIMDKESSDIKHQTPGQWWKTWQRILDRAILEEPRLYALWAVAEARRARTAVVGRDWLTGTCVSPQKDSCLLAESTGNDETSNDLYRTLGLEHLERLIDHGKLDPRFKTTFNLKSLCSKMSPQRDRLLDWRAWQQLISQGCLWTLDEIPWKTEQAKPLPGSKELPQWAFLRLAMAMAVDEKDPNLWAFRFYESLSSLSVVASETLLREGGVPGARYLEDQSARVPDNFEGIQTALHRAAVGTKWTGTVTLDWRGVRAKGSLVAGRRKSPGVAGFLRSIDAGLQAQGRRPGDRPVTVVMPLWHLEALDFIGALPEMTPQLQPVIVVPDEFFKRLKEGLPWFMFDPEVFPEVLENDTNSYQNAIDAANNLKNRRNDAIIKMDAAKVWKKLLKSAHRGAPFFLFEDAQKPFTPFPDSGPPVAGIDGVGSLPCLNETEKTLFRSVAWPSAAINLAMAVTPDGTPNLEHIKENTHIALRLLDNAINASKPVENGSTWMFRPVCLGAIGLYEAIENASAQSRQDPMLMDAWVSGLAEAWAVAVVHADQALVMERGAAPAWNKLKDGRTFDPIQSMERLTERRQGARALTLTARQDWKAHHKGHRCCVRTVWAPFAGAAALAGVTPGGIGTLQPLDEVMDEEQRERIIPTPFLLHHIQKSPERMNEWKRILQHPKRTKRWPDVILNMVQPNREQWERRLHHAALIRPWIDQGMSVTLPAHLPEDLLHILLKKAWWLGLNSLRFSSLTGEAYEPDNNPDDDGNMVDISSTDT